MLLSNFSFSWTDGFDWPISSAFNLIEVNRVICEGWIWPHLFSFCERNGRFRSFLLSWFSFRICGFLFLREKKNAGRGMHDFSITGLLMYCTDSLLQNIFEVSRIVSTAYKGLYLHNQSSQDLILGEHCRDSHVTKCNLVQKSPSLHQSYQPHKQKCCNLSWALQDFCVS